MGRRRRARPLPRRGCAARAPSRRRTRPTPRKYACGRGSPAPPDSRARDSSRRLRATRSRRCAIAPRLEMLSTRRLNTPTGGPSIDSNAMVGPELPVVSAAFDEVVSVQPAAHAARSAATTPRRNKARARALKSPNHPDTPLRSGAGGHAAKVRERRRLHCLGSAKRPAGPVALFHECNRIDVTSVIRLAAMGGTAVAEEARRVPHRCRGRGPRRLGSQRVRAAP